MISVADYLYQSELEHPFGNNITTCAYLLLRSNGNILMYSSSKLDEAKVRELGGITAQYLNHRGEASPSCDWVRQTFGAPLGCHEAEANAVRAHCLVDWTFEGEKRLHADLLAVPTPGHSPGSTCYLWDAPDTRYLFTGDTLYLDDGRWRVFVRRGSANQMIQSLQRILDIGAGVVVPGLFSGEPSYRAVEPKMFFNEISAVIDRLNRGKRH